MERRNLEQFTPPFEFAIMIHAAIIAHGLEFDSWTKIGQA